MTTRAASDIPAGNWIDRYLPPPVRPYLRLARFDRPVGIWLLMFPCWWGTALASHRWPVPVVLLLFAVGAAVMRAAGCILNDIADRKFDARVARTAGRPIASGAISVPKAIAFMIGLSLIGLLVLLQFNRTTIVVGIASLALVAVYPFAKRVTDWPQAVLGLTFNWGPPLGWTAVRGQLDPPALLLYGAGLFWTLGYDTIYAHQDKDDDLLIGVRSTALRLGRATRLWMVGFYAAALALLAAAGVAAGLGWWIALALVPAAAHLGWQVRSVDFDDPADCLSKFRSNSSVGLAVFAGIVTAQIVV